MKPADDIHKLIKKLQIEPGAEMDRRVHGRITRALEKWEKTKSAAKQPNIWRIIMNKPITKLATAAVIIIAVILSMNLLDKSIPAAYAIEQTIEANHTIQTIHLRMLWGSENIAKNEFMDCWVKYDDGGEVSNFRWNLHGDVREDDDNLKFTVWNDGVLETWMPLKNVVIVIRVNDAETYWQNFAKDYDPKLILQQLYDDSQGNEAIELTISEPTQDGDPIYVEAINYDNNTRLELIVDPETRLIMQLSEYSLGEQEDELIKRIEFFAYNQPVNPFIFELSGIPDDAFIYDQVDQLVGLEKGDLTEDEIAIKVVYECLEATIAQDYEEVSRLMEGDPGESFEDFLKEEFEARLTRIVSIGQPKPHEIWNNILFVPCEIEVENEESEKWIVNIYATAKAIGYQPGCRWIVHTEIYDQLGLVGLEKGDLTEDEIAVKVVRECLEATIAKNYEEVSRLMEGAPGDTIENFIEERFRAKISRVISFGQLQPHERWKTILYVPCKIEVENEERESWEVSIIATAKPIGYQPIHRWIVHTELKVNE